ncbi:Interferon-related developmental regulator, C-terminal [Sesbania bispinosa]|nr:Interferon-related developmental regulator, C-terminal [Sesbania bispinosa]
MIIIITLRSFPLSDHLLPYYHTIGLLALTVGCGDNAREIFEESLHPLDEFLTSKSDLIKIPSLLECLAIITFVGGNDQEETERSMDIMWRVIHPKLDKEDRPVRIAAGEALALNFEIGTMEKFSANSNIASDMTQQESKSQESYIHLQGLKGKVINQIKNLSVEAGGKGSAKKDLNSQRNLFRDIVEFFEENKFLHDVFGFTPRKRYLNNNEHRMSSGEKRMFKSPNSVQNKARTQLLNKQRLLSEGRNLGHYAANMVDDEAF